MEQFQKYWIEQLPNEWLKDIDIFEPDYYIPDKNDKEHMCKHVNKYMPRANCREIVDMIIKSEKFYGKYDEFSFSLKFTRFLSKLLAVNLKKHGLNEAHSTDSGNVVIYNSIENKLNASNTFAKCNLMKIFNNFSWKDSLTFDNDINGSLVFTLSKGIPINEQKQIVLDMTEYLFEYVMSREDLKEKYANIQSKFEGFHEEENFDHPTVFIISALLTVIIEQYGFASVQSNVDWNENKDIGFGIHFNTMNTDKLHNRIDTQSIMREKTYELINRAGLKYVICGFSFLDNEFSVGEYSNIYGIRSDFKNFSVILHEYVRFIDMLRK